MTQKTKTTRHLTSLKSPGSLAGLALAASGRRPVGAGKGGAK
jgi:hypothetical protein